jgi:hypothetical protein
MLMPTEAPVSALKQAAPSPSAPPPCTPQESDISDGIQPQSITLLGNYAVQVTWEDGFNQVAPYELIGSLSHLAVDEPVLHAAAAEGLQEGQVVASVAGLQAVAELV